MKIWSKISQNQCLKNKYPAGCFPNTVPGIPRDIPILGYPGIIPSCIPVPYRTVTVYGTVRYESFCQQAVGPYRYGTVRYDTVRYGTVPGFFMFVIQYSNTVQYGTVPVPYCTVRYRYSTYRTVRYGTVRYPTGTVEGFRKRVTLIRPLCFNWLF